MTDEKKYLESKESEMFVTISGNQKKKNSVVSSTQIQRTWEVRDKELFFVCRHNEKELLSSKS
jgi:hypothetical protein